MKTLDKIKKLLLLAENNDSIEESKAAFAKAQALMMKHGIDVTNNETENVEPEYLYVGKIGYIFWWEKALAGVIAENFRCASYMSRVQKSKFQIAFVGLKTDVEIAETMYLYALRVAEKIKKAYVKERKKKEKENSYKNTVAIKNDYLFGFIYGIRETLSEQVKKNNWKMMLLKNRKVKMEEEKIGEHLQNSAKIRTNKDPEAHREGYVEGIKIGKKFRK